MPQRALLSVSDKTGIVDAAKRLQALGYEIVSTGGTQKALSDAGIAVTSVEDVTTFPECFGGRVKTMHPKIMGGVLFRRSNADDVVQAERLTIDPIDVVIVNLYPFAEQLRVAGDELRENSQLIEMIDIGGPTLLRSAAKNYADVTVMCDSADYERVLTALESGEVNAELRRELAAKVFLHTAAYDALITKYLSNGTNDGMMLTSGTELRYGENPHQWGKYFTVVSDSQNLQPATRNSWRTLHQGKPLSYLNILDADAAWSAVCEFTEPTAVLVKHANPSGIASHASIDEAFQRAYDTDRLSAFGVIIALNRKCTKVIAQKIIDQKIFTEVIVATGYEDDTLQILSQKPNIRVITQTNGDAMKSQILYRSVKDGMLVQNADTKVVTKDDLKVVTEKKPTDAQIDDMLFAWSAVKYAKSNAIVLARDKTTIGIGAGQTSRVDSTWIAVKRAGDRAKGSVMASDAFFPFPDSAEEAAKHGIAAIIQPGGSIRDEEVFKKADELGMIMVLTEVRAFRH